MADKTADDSGNDVLGSSVAFAMPYIERFTRERIAPYVVHSSVFDRIKKAFSHETVVMAGTAIPGFMSMLARKIPDGVFFSPEIADTVRDSIVIFFSEIGKGLAGDLSPTPEKMKEVETAAYKAVDDWFAQEVFYDRDGDWHFAACHKWQGGRNAPAKATLKGVLEIHRQPGRCCRTHAEELVAKVAEPAKAGDAAKAASAPVQGKIPPGASVIDILGLLPEDARKKLRTWLQSLSKKKFEEVAALMTQHLDTIAEGVELAEVEDAQKLRFLGLMKSRTELRKSKIAEMRKELEKDALKAFEASMKGLKALNESIVSTGFLARMRQETVDLRAGKPAAKKTKLSLWDIFGL
jgi:hypothetical protein